MSCGLDCAFQEFKETSRVHRALNYKHPSKKEFKTAIYCTEKNTDVRKEHH